MKRHPTGDDRHIRRLFYACCEDLSRDAAWTVHIREVVNSWERSGIRVTLFAPGIHRFSAPPACTVVYVPTVPLRIAWEYLYLFVLGLYIVVFGLGRRPDALYCREMSLMAPAACAARLIGVPVVTEINGFLLDDLKRIGASRIKRLVFRFFQRTNIAVSDSLIFVGRNYLARFRGEYRLDEAKVRLVPNGVDTGLFCPGDRARALREIGLDPAKQYVTFVGTFYPHSMAPVIVAAARSVVADHADIDFVLVGDGHDLACCRKLAADLGIAGRVHFPGMRKNRDIPAYLRASTLLVDLIAEGSESATMKLLEYMSAGGVVVSNSESAFGIPLTHRVNYYRIGQPTPEELARAVGVLISDPALTEQIGVNARRLIVDNFSWHKTAEKLVAVIQEVRNRR